MFTILKQKSSMDKPLCIDVKIIVDFFIYLILFISLCIYVFLRLKWKQVNSQNIILYFNLIDISHILTLGLSLLVGFILQEKHFIFTLLLALVIGGFFISNISFSVKNRSKYKEAKRNRRKIIDSSILDQEI